MDKKVKKQTKKKLPKLLAPGMLAQMHGNRPHFGRNNKQTQPSFDVQEVKKNTNYSKKSSSSQPLSHPHRCVEATTFGDMSSHTLVMHFQEMELQENDFNEDSSFLDILNLCKKFVDIYSVGFKVSDGDGVPVKCDMDVMALLDKNEGVPCIDLYLENDKKAKPLGFRMPEDLPGDNTSLGCLLNPEVRNVKILGDLRANEKVKVCGTLIGGVERSSTVQLFMTLSEKFDVNEELQAISESKTTKEFCLPLKSVGQFVVAKYTPISADGKFGEPVFIISDKPVEVSGIQKERKVRGEKKNKRVADLKQGEKLEVIFYNDRAVGRNQKYWSRHLGRIVRDRNICPVQVLVWKDIGHTEKEHMWEAVKECFHNPNIDLYRDETLEHMHSLWTAWRSSLNVNFVKPCKNISEATNNVPKGVLGEDWKWLVHKKFMTEEFLKISEQNSKNKSASDMGMPHRTGSMPHREIIFENGGKDSQDPDLGVIFF
ncbi:unnamed protein product [Cuscuta epithymum]|uniref:AIR9-like A9 domain-containing protein n=1 Tax=Cuscuta epithymum TaxID=186058 RepID=A0AAV0DPC0_9ASTE|nr:unnamed protein product [Cuscuta epithymum]